LKTNEDLRESLQGKVPEVYSIGACKDPKALIVDAVEDAAKIASSI
jgi:thioredoxin reductase